MARLIDAHAFEESHCMDCPYRKEGNCTNDDPICSTIADLRDAPTVDAVEVVRAYWIGEEPGDWHCSHCGEYAADGGYEQTRYCPNCGASMDGGSNG